MFIPCAFCSPPAAHRPAQFSGCRKNTTRSLAVGSTAILALAAVFLPQLAQAASEISPPQSVWEPLRGELTLGIGGTEDRLTGSTDLTVPLWKGADQNDMLFLDGHWTGNSGHQQAYNVGLGYRHRVGGSESDIIVGVNAFWDHGIFHGQSFDQFGTGLEVLSHWVDFRINGYFPEGGDEVFDHSRKTRRSTKSRTATSQTVSVVEDLTFPFNRTTTTTTTTTATKTRKTRTRFYENRETAMPGFDTELGFLIPGLDRYMETRVFGGYAYYQGGYEHDISAGTARLECRVLPALILDTEYKGDDRLLDGRNNWFWGIRGEIPFDLGNLCEGQSPFAGITQAFTPKWTTASGSAGPVGYSKDDKKMVLPPEMLRNRMNENIIRAWRPQIDYSGPILTRTKRSGSTKVNQSVVREVQVEQLQFVNGD